MPNSDPKLAIVSADSFFTNAVTFIDEIAYSKTNAHEKAIQRIGDLIASATSLTLALELYLKAMLIAFRIEVPRTHNLDDIFKKVPVDVRQLIQSKYDRYLATSPWPVAELQLQTADKAVPWPSEDASSLSEKTLSDLNSLFKRTGNDFSTWRYLYEAVSGEVREIRYEFARLVAASKAIRAAHMRFMYSD